MRILLISISFSPRMDVGAKRFSFIGEQWERDGHQLEILARRIRADEAQDLSLPQPGQVHWTRSIVPKRLSGEGMIARIYNRLIADFVGVPDAEIGWLPSGVLSGRRVTKQLKPDVIIATGPSFTSFLTGAILSRSTGVPLILDYRDPWTAFNWSETTIAKRRDSRFRRKLERWAVNSAEAAVFATEIMQDHFTANFGARKPGVLEVITNGFKEHIAPLAMSLLPDTFNILYAGTMYGERKLSNVAKAIEKLRHRGNLIDVEFAIHIFGKVRADDLEHITRTGLRYLVHVHAPVDHREVLNYMRAADALFLPSGSEVHYALPFKTFDYLSVCRPILAVTPAGSAVAELMARIDCGEVADADTPSSIADALERLISRTNEYSYAGREHFTWSEVARRYGELLGKVSATRK